MLFLRIENPRIEVPDCKSGTAGLDDLRIAQLMQLISKQTFGQIFLTDARPERSKKILGELAAEVVFYSITDEKIMG